jgi:hypothetical protein
MTRLHPAFNFTGVLLRMMAHAANDGSMLRMMAACCE